MKTITIIDDAAEAVGGAVGVASGMCVEGWLRPADPVGARLTLWLRYRVLICGDHREEKHSITQLALGGTRPGIDLHKLSVMREMSVTRNLSNP